jgi:hypothetical protein
LDKIPSNERHAWGGLRIDGYLKGKQVISRYLSGRGIDSKFMLLTDDTSMAADGADATRVVLSVADEFGNIRPYANDPIVVNGWTRRTDRRQPLLPGRWYGGCLGSCEGAGWYG